MWRKEQGASVSHLTLTSFDSIPAGPHWNAEGREATDEPCSLYIDFKEAWKGAGSWRNK